MYQYCGLRLHAAPVCQHDGIRGFEIIKGTTAVDGMFTLGGLASTVLPGCTAAKRHISKKCWRNSRNETTHPQQFAVTVRLEFLLSGELTMGILLGIHLIMDGLIIITSGSVVRSPANQ